MRHVDACPPIALVGHPKRLMPCVRRCAPLRPMWSAGNIELHTAARHMQSRIGDNSRTADSTG